MKALSLLFVVAAVLAAGYFVNFDVFGAGCPCAEQHKDTAVRVEAPAAVKAEVATTAIMPCGCTTGACSCNPVAAPKAAEGQPVSAPVKADPAGDHSNGPAPKCGCGSCNSCTSTSAPAAAGDDDVDTGFHPAQCPGCAKCGG